MTKKKCECKNLCIDCANYSCNEYGAMGCFPPDDTPICFAYKTTKTSCVDGETTCEYDECSKHNKSGNCKKFKPLPHKELRRILNDYISDNGKDCFMCSSVERELALDLLRRIDGKESEFLEPIWYGDTPFEHDIVVTKKAIKQSLDRRGCSLSAQRYADEYSTYIEKISDEQCKKERLWIKRVRKWLDE